MSADSDFDILGSVGVDVRTYGAVGDGTTDDTAAFTAALAAAAGSVVFVPAGTYVVNTVTAAGTTRIVLEDGATLKHRTGSTSHLFVISGPYFSLTGGSVDGNHAGQGANRRYLLRCDLPAGCEVRVRNVRFTGSQACAVYARNFGGHLDVSDCRFADMAEHDGEYQHWTCAVCVDGAQPGRKGMMRFNRNTLIGTTTPALTGGAPGGIFFAPVTDYPNGLGTGATIEAIGNWFWGIGQHCANNDIAALHTYPMTLGARFIGNYFEACGFSAIAAKSCQDVVIADNTVLNGQISAKNMSAEGAISVVIGYQAGSAARSRAVVTGNIVDNPGGESTAMRQVGIAVRGDPDSPATDCLVSNNIVYESGQAGIGVSYVNGITIADNIVRAGTTGTTFTEFGIRVDQTRGDVILSGNRVHSPNGHGLFALNAVDTARFFLHGNVFEHTASGGYGVLLRGVGLAKFTGNTINADPGVALSITTNGTHDVGRFIWDATNTIEAGAISISWPNVTTASGQLIGTGSPEGVVAAPVGTTYTNLSGGATSTLYVKTSGTGRTGWTAK
ncbi:right-handed parallel beta-helix repeat-containing protein [Micromonospora sp. NPDC005367]|uniref:right-handed parallel beta-helix repeat-containing protein n=1 Tax=Micromonospora sp. NPDC005367 TaxID=3155590 RepID=UPI0033A46457